MYQCVAVSSVSTLLLVKKATAAFLKGRSCYRTPTVARAYTDRCTCVHRPSFVRTPTGVRQHGGLSGMLGC